MHEGNVRVRRHTGPEEPQGGLDSLWPKHGTLTDRRDRLRIRKHLTHQGQPPGQSAVVKPHTLQ